MACQIGVPFFFGTSVSFCAKNVVKCVEVCYMVEGSILLTERVLRF